MNDPSFDDAVRLHQQGRLDAAEEAYRRILPLVLAFMPGTELEPFVRESRNKPGVVGDL